MNTPETLSPTSGASRIHSLDIIRGISVLGILLMNIVGFGLYKAAYSDPTVAGGANGWNLKLWWINSMLFEGTMRGLFSMLFGAGILLFLSRTSPAKDSTQVIDLYFRRTMWLLLFGVLHAYLLLWPADTLYHYALAGIFAFSFRHLKPWYLVIAAVLAFAIPSTLEIPDYLASKKTYAEAEAATLKKKQGIELSTAEEKAIKDWDEVVKTRKPDAEKIKEDMTARHQGYFSIVRYLAPVNQTQETTVSYRHKLWDALAMIFLGMAFYKWDILQAKRNARFYWLLALMGYGIGLTVNYFETQHVLVHHFSVHAQEQSHLTYNLGRVFTTFGHIALIVLFIKSGWLAFLQQAFKATGQMAFSNYIGQTIICNFIFLGYGFALFGKLQRYELYYVVLGVWVFQLVFSSIWLHFFRFGPLEWLWRSLTYWKVQPLKKRMVEAVV